MKLFIDFILVFGFTICLLILTLLLRSSRKGSPKNLLLLFFTLILLVITHAYSTLYDLSYLYRSTFLFDFMIIWLLGPILYSYIHFIFSDSTNKVRFLLKHFTIPTLILLFIGIPVLISDMGVSINYISAIEEYQIVVIGFRNCFFIYYLILSLQKLRFVTKITEHHFSNISSQDLHWFLNLIYGCLFFILVDLGVITYELIFENPPFNIGHFTITSIIVTTSYLGYHGVHQSKVLLPEFLFEKEKKTNSSNNFTKLSQQEVKELERELKTALEVDKVYLNQELTLGTLAKKIDTTDKKLSTFLNQYTGTTFYEYINSFRVKEVQERLNSEKYDNYTLLAIAYDSGFNSKASFNRIFKRTTGLSPSQYKKQL